MLDANLIMVSAIIGGVILASIKCICDSMKVVSENRKEEVKYKYLEMQARKELETDSKN